MQIALINEAKMLACKGVFAKLSIRYNTPPRASGKHAEGVDQGLPCGIYRLFWHKTWINAINFLAKKNKKNIIYVTGKYNLDAGLLLKLLEKYLKDFKIKFEGEEKKEFRKEILVENYRRMVIMSVTVFFLELVIFLMPSIMFTYKTITLIFLIANIFTIPPIFIISRRLENKNYSKGIMILAYVVQYLYIAEILYLGMAMTLLTQNKFDLLHMYIVCVVAVVSFMTFGMIERSALLAVTYAIFVILLSVCQQDKEKVILFSVNTFTCNFLAWVFSFIKYTNTKKWFADKKQLQKLAQCDAMTKFFNHETTLNKLMAEVKKAYLAKTTLSLIMIDIDNFKEINDKEGHAAGDATIKELARIIRSATSETDILGRYGGDEFMIVLPNADIAKAKTVADAVMAGASNCEIPVTLSAGISEYECEDFKEYVRNVDKKLYKAKEHGKNMFIDRLD